MSTNYRVNIGIDIGTTASKFVIRMVTDGVTRDVNINQTGKARILPTVVTYHADRSFDIGHAAQATHKRPGSSTFRLIKQGFPNATVVPDSHDVSQSRPTKAVVVDFLMKFYYIIKAAYEQDQKHYHLSSWGNTRVDFLFAVPAGWSADVVGKALVEAAIQAGYEKEPGHRVLRQVMTESEATASHLMARGELKINSNVLVVDVGGGTSDLAAMRVIDPVRGIVRFLGLEPVSGEGIGSAQINRIIERKIASCLSAIADKLNGDLHAIARDVATCAKFEAFKRAIGDCNSGVYEKGLSCDLGLTSSLNDMVLEDCIGIQSGKLFIKADLFLAAFEEQITGTKEQLAGTKVKASPGVKGQIDTVLEDLYVQRRHAMAPIASDSQRISATLGNIDTIILSGGLGGCRRGKERIQMLLAHDSETGHHRNLPKIDIRVAENPQLCVAEGLADSHLLNREEQSPMPVPRSIMHRVGGFVARIGGRQR